MGKHRELFSPPKKEEPSIWDDFNFDKYKEISNDIEKNRVYDNRLLFQIQGENDANLTLDELSALNHYQICSYYMNILFNTNLSDIYSMFGEKDEVKNFRSIITLNNVYDAINLFSAIYKIHTHRNNDDIFHFEKVYRGVRSFDVVPCLGFKSFTSSRAIAHNFSLYYKNYEITNGVVIGIKFPRNIPYVSYEELYKYVPCSGNYHEKEFLFSPFSYVSSCIDNNFNKIYELKESKISTDSINNEIDYDKVLYNMNVILHEYEKLKNNRYIDEAECSKLLCKLEDDYKFNSLLILRYITNKCYSKKNEIDASIDCNENKKII